MPASATETRDTPDFPAGAALVVGGSGGLGAEIARRLAAAGSDVAVTFHANAMAAETLVGEIAATGRRASAHRMPLDDADTVARTVADIVADHGALHSMVFSVGPDIGQPFVSQVTPEEWREAMTVEPTGYFNVLQAVLPHLRKTKGSIVAVTSAATIRYAPRDILSAAPKASVDLLTRAIAREEGRFGIRANCVAPGFIATGLGQRLLDTVLSDAEKQAVVRNTALRRIGSAGELADVAVFLASARASFVTGQTIAVDGGYAA
jgi:NAD(P)-dependent dehydrogenase (short-subunit alcohol dehydrogenase family)